MRTKFLRIGLSSVLIASMLAVPAYAETALLTGSDVNLRAGPGTNYRVIDCLAYGTELTVTDRSGGTWYAVDYDGTPGFISAAYLDIREEEPGEIAPAPDDTQSSVDACINAMYVRFRSGPGSEYSILGEYNKGKSVSVLGSSGAWTACVIDGRFGYVYSDYVNSSASSVPMVTPRPIQTEPEKDIYLENAQASLQPAVSPAAQQGIATLTPQARPTPSQQPTLSQQPAPQETAGPISVTDEAGYINANYVCFRTGPSTNYSIIDQFNKGTPLTINGSEGDWTACTINGDSGYVYSLYVSRKIGGIQLNPVMDQPMENETVQPAVSMTPVQEPTSAEVPLMPVQPVITEEKAGYISGNNVRLREGPSMSSGILDELFYGNSVIIKGTSGDWTAVSYNGTDGYVYSQYVREGSLSAALYTAVEESGSGDKNEIRKQLVDYALQFVGYNYTWGGKSPSTGFDCSGLVYFVYSQFGYTLNRVAEDQARNGTAVSGELLPGDILCFYSGSSYIGHVGIYIGNGMFVHAQNSATGVVITELAGSYANRGYVARRILT